ELKQLVSRIVKAGLRQFGSDDAPNQPDRKPEMLGEDRPDQIASRNKLAFVFPENLILRVPFRNPARAPSAHQNVLFPSDIAAQPFQRLHGPQELAAAFRSLRRARKPPSRRANSSVGGVAGDPIIGRGSQRSSLKADCNSSSKPRASPDQSAKDEFVQFFSRLTGERAVAQPGWSGALLNHCAFVDARRAAI